VYSLNLVVLLVPAGRCVIVEQA